MDFYQVIINRVSNKTFQSTPIPKEKLNRMINSALLAPSWKNKTCYRFVFVDDPNQKDLLSKTILNSTKEATQGIKQAPILAVIVADPTQSGYVEDKSYYMVDCGIAMEHLVLAATNEGYGSCWIGSFDEDKIRSILDVPETFKIVAMTPIGETDEKIEHYPPKNFSEHIYFNSLENRDSSDRN